MRERIGNIRGRTGREGEEGKGLGLRVNPGSAMSTNLQKRETKQIRIEIGLHRSLKIASAQNGKTMSKLLDEICEQYFKHENLKHDKIK